MMANAHTPQTGATQREKVLAYVRLHPDCTVDDIAPVLGLEKVRVAQYLVRLKYAKLAFSTHVKGDTRLRWNAPDERAKAIVESFRSRVLAYVTLHPGCYSAEITRATGMNTETVSRSLYTLRKAGLVVKEPASPTGACRWVLVDVESPPDRDMPFCTVKTEWEPVRMPPQGIFAALGL